MLDFTSVLYLGMWHPTESLRPWRRLTTGAPAALSTPPGSRQVAAELAELVGTPAAQLGTSTLHLFWDLFGILARRDVTVLVDGGAYPIARWGIERLIARRVTVRGFRHFDTESLAAQMRMANDGRRAPVVVADGFCPGCGQPAPIEAYRSLVRPHGGLLVLDDTQSVGVLGEPDGAAPYGTGGGGILRATGERGDDVIVVASLAKAFGVPMAFVAGSHAWIERLERESGVRIHCSPPSAAAIHAGAHALALNRRDGDGMRARLAARVRQFKAELARSGLRSRGGLFPVQRVELPPDTDPTVMRDELARLGIKTVVLAPRCDQRRLVFVLTARHRPEHIALAVSALAECLRATARAEWRAS